MFIVKKVSIHVYYGSHVGTRKSAHQPISQNDIEENSPTSVTHKSAFIDPNDFKFGTETHCMVL